MDHFTDITFLLIAIFSHVLIVVTLIQLYQILFVHLPLARFSFKKVKNEANHPVSVIIYARNHAVALEKNIPELFTQDHASFELVIVNDCSWDNTEESLRSLAAAYPQLKIVNVPVDDRFRRNKKFALSLGIKAAQYEHILFTEADYVPKSKKWIANMQANFSEKTALVLGYVPYPQGSGFWSIFKRFDHFFRAISVFSAALKGKAYSAYGQNVAFTKTTFFSGKGYASHMHLNYGETDFFVNQHATRNNTRLALSPTSYVYTDKAYSYADFLKDAFTRMDIEKEYSFGTLFRLKSAAISAILFYTSIVVLVILRFKWEWVLGIYLFRLALQYGVYFSIAKRLKHAPILWALPILEPIYYLHNLVLKAAYLIKNKN